MVADLGRYVRDAAARGELVVQPRMGMADPGAMAAGIAAVAGLPIPTVATITIDSYTRVGDHAAAGRALSTAGALNGFPIVSHGPELTARVASAAGGDVPVQVRHGSARPGAILATMAEAGLTASEGGPVSYCLPYGRTPLAEAVGHWGDATEAFGELVSHHGGRAHLETFGGCLLGQLCPPSLLIAMSVLEAMFFVQHDLESVSLSYAQQCHPVQDVEALAALDRLAGELLPDGVDRHIVLYTYMGVFPRTSAGARSLLADSARIAVLGGAQRLIVKTDAEAHRIPTVAENLSSLGAAAAVAARARQEGLLPDRSQVDCSAVLDEARRLVHAVLEISGDVGRGLVGAFATGVLDVPYCLHDDNAGLTRGAIDEEGRLYWARTGRMPLPAVDRASARAVTSGDLLRMLNHTAERYDRAALTVATDAAELDAAELDAAAPSVPAPAGELMPASPEGGEGDVTTDAAAEKVVRVAVVGSGPRGLSVVERLAARSAQASDAGRLEVWLLDDVEVGCGRIWRTDQSPWLLMNTAADEVTMFSGPPDDGPTRGGAGPSLAEWWADADPENADPDGYAPRAVYGRYLRYVLDRVEATAPADRFTLHRVLARVEDAHRKGAGSGSWTLRLRDGRDLEVDRVVLTTGHPISEPPEEQRYLEAFAAGRPGLQYIRGDSTADLPLDRIPPGTEIGVIGLGLSFYDVLAEMTLGRGGRFVADADVVNDVNDVNDGAGALRYLPSGREPVLIAGSRGGVPLRARGRNQKRPDHSYRPRILTLDRIRRLRALGPLDFRADVLPLLAAEIDLVHLLTSAKARGAGSSLSGSAAPDDVLENLERDVDRLGAAQAVGIVQAGLGLTDVAGLDVETLARPFHDRAFASPAEYRRAVREWIDGDLAAAAEGNVDGSFKAALDVIRDVRAVLRAAVDFGGLSPESHEDFLRWFVPLASFLSTGPPMVRLAQTQALLDAGVLVLVGPGTRFGAGPDGFVVESPQVAGSRRSVRVLLDARTPVQDLARDTSGLSRRLHSRGVLTTFTNTSGTSSFRTGGVTVTPAPFHSVGLDGPDPTLYVLGIPTEFTRWFTQVGSGRPRVRTGFTADADAIAADLLTAATSAPARSAPVMSTASREPGDRRPHEMIKESA